LKRLKTQRKNPKKKGRCVYVMSINYWIQNKLKNKYGKEINGVQLENENPIDKCRLVSWVRQENHT
jgi:hypothetical protein